MILALVPAAGHSTRMGRSKLTLPLGGRTVIEHIVGALRAGGADLVLVVCATHVVELTAPARTAGAEILCLPQPTPDMRATVEQGLHWLEQHVQPAPEDAWLLAPADHPTLESGVVCALCESYTREPSRSILIPTHAGRRGHPALIAWRYVPLIRSLPSDQGINAFFRTHADLVTEFSTPSPTVLADLDTVDDYERLQREWRTRD